MRRYSSIDTINFIFQYSGVMYVDVTLFMKWCNTYPHLDIDSDINKTRLSREIVYSYLYYFYTRKRM